MKDLKNCKKCNRLFQSKDGASLCSRCNDDIDDEFTRVKEYIYDNPSSNLKDISIGTGVAATAILKWIREGKIVLDADVTIAFCQRCEEPTDGERFCQKCQGELAQGLKRGIENKEPERKKTGMHIKR